MSQPKPREPAEPERETESGDGPHAENAPDTGIDWRIYHGGAEPHDGIDRLPAAPPWRRFDGAPLVPSAYETGSTAERRLGGLGRAYRADDDVVETVNAALYLRRPLLVTGKPGTGKSTLAYSIAAELRLGSVLYWPINSRSTLADGLYHYDAIGRLQEANLRQALTGSDESPTEPDLGRFVRLGALGTALLPRSRPRVLLIDELDKSDIDLPNDLLNVFEEGRFEIPELARLDLGGTPVEVMLTGGQDRVPVHHGQVECRAFPVVVITSNGEREFPPAFLRRCMRLNIQPPDPDQLAEIVIAQLGPEIADQSTEVIQRFLRGRDHGDLATDQLLNAIYLATSGSRPPAETREHLLQRLLRPLNP